MAGSMFSCPTHVFMVHVMFLWTVYSFHGPLSCFHGDPIKTWVCPSFYFKIKRCPPLCFYGAFMKTLGVPHEKMR